MNKSNLSIDEELFGEKIDNEMYKPKSLLKDISEEQDIKGFLNENGFNSENSRKN